MTMGEEEEGVFVESPSCVQSVFPHALLLKADAKA